MLLALPLTPDSSFLFLFLLPAKSWAFWELQSTLIDITPLQTAPSSICYYTHCIHLTPILTEGVFFLAGTEGGGEEHTDSGLRKSFFSLLEDLFPFSAKIGPWVL